MTALILHNVVVSDHVMGDVNCQYNPAESAEDFGDFRILPQLNATIQNEANEVYKHDNNNNKVPQLVIDVVNVSGQWESLLEETEHCHLCLALMKKMNS